MSFHDDKLWQQVYVAVLDLLEAFDALEEDLIVKEAVKTALKTLTLASDGIARRDRRERDMKLKDAYYKITKLRSLLSVLWARETLSDEVFGKLDGIFESVSGKLPK